MERLRAARVPLVLCTSKTRAEVEPIRAALANDHPFIVENGGAVVVPRGYFPFELHAARLANHDKVIVIPIGTPYAELVAALAAASRETGIAVRGFADMTAMEVATATGLTRDEAGLAKQREFDEPFEVIDAERTSVLLDAIVRAGNRWTGGGRFLHLTGRNDKAVAVRVLLDFYRRAFGAIHVAGLGDAMNDADFLREVDAPVVIASAHANEVVRHVPRATITRSPGPRGWNEAVLELLTTFS